MRPLKVMSTQEVANMTGVPRNTIAVWMKRGHLPAPDVVLTCGPIWRQARIEHWMNGEGRERIARTRGA